MLPLAPELHGVHQAATLIPHSAGTAMPAIASVHGGSLLHDAGAAAAEYLGLSDTLGVLPLPHSRAMDNIASSSVHDGSHEMYAHTCTCHILGLSTLRALGQRVSARAMRIGPATCVEL